MEVTLHQLDSLPAAIGSLWNIPNNESLGILIEQSQVDSLLPIASEVTSTQLISGELPDGLELVDSRLQGTLVDVAYYTTSSFVIRARAGGRMEDRTIQITVSGPDSPEWQTPAGLLPVGSDPTTLYVLDQDLVNYQLEATDADEITGQQLSFYLSSGELPPGLRINKSGVIQGITDLLKPNIASMNSLPYVPNRTYPFTVTVTDGVESVDRDFMIYVVSYDYLLSEIDIDPVTGVGLESVPPIRKPMWLTPANLGTVRADNNATFPLEIVDYTDGVTDYVRYSLEEINNDLSLSVLPENTQLDSETGVVYGFIPPQDPITIPHKFTVKAEVITPNTVEINGDLISTQVAVTGDSCFAIQSLPDDVQEETTGSPVRIRNRGYTITEFTDTGVCVDPPLFTEPDLVTAVNTTQDSKSFYFARSSEESRDFYQDGVTQHRGVEYQLSDVIPVVEYRIRKADYSPSDSDYTRVPENQVTVVNTLGYLDEGYSELESRGYPYAVEDVTWSTKTPQQRTVLDEIEEVADRISTVCGAPIFFRRISQNNLGVVLESTECGRNESLIQQAVSVANTNIQLETVQHDDTKDYAFMENRFQHHVRIDTDLTVVVQTGDVIRNRYLETGKLFKGEISATRTFTVDTIGEIDSFIEWTTSRDLGVIQRELPSRLRVVAETSYENSTITYELTGGNLPEGMQLTSAGYIIGMPVYDSVGVYSFKIKASEQQFPVETEQTFNLEVFAESDFQVCDVFLKALPSVSDREKYQVFINSLEIDPDQIYRPQDPTYGIQNSLDILVYSGLERSALSAFYSATETHHRRKRYILGEFHTAEARETPDSSIVYEVVYIQVIDPSDQGESDDLGKYTKASTSNMRRELSVMGDDERRRLPLWMRTAQNGFQELDFTSAVPVVYCIPGQGEKIAQQLNFSDFKPNEIDYETDRYVIKNPSDYSQEKYVVFNNSRLTL